MEWWDRIKNKMPAKTRPSFLISSISKFRSAFDLCQGNARLSLRPIEMLRKYSGWQQCPCHRFSLPPPDSATGNCFPIGHALARMHRA